MDSGSGAATVNLQRGNAALEPTQSTNYDLSLEHYFDTGGILSLAVFHKELSNWIYRSDFIAPPGQFPEYAAIPNLTAVRVSSLLNGDQAKVTGFEINFEKTIGWGFSVGANYTKLSFDVNRAQTGLDSVPGQSDRLIRASINYEINKFIARLSYRDSGSILDSQVAFSTPAAVAYFQGLGLGQITTNGSGVDVVNLGLYEISRPTLDFTGEYRLTRNVRLFVQMNNLLRENALTLLGDDKRFVEKHEYTSWTALTGVKINF